MELEREKRQKWCNRPKPQIKQENEGNKNVVPVFGTALPFW